MGSQRQPFVSPYLCAEDLVVGQGVDGRDVSLEGQNDENRRRLLSKSASQQSLRRKNKQISILVTEMYRINRERQRYLSM